MLDQRTDPRGVDINFGGNSTGRFGQPQTIAALKQVMQQYRVDPLKVYVTGTSLGGMGTWEMLLAYNAVDGGRGRIFAAGMPLAGTHRRADPDEAARVLRDVPIWAIHGGSDREISPDWDRRMAKLLSGLARCLRSNGCKSKANSRRISPTRQTKPVSRMQRAVRAPLMLQWAEVQGQSPERCISVPDRRRCPGPLFGNVVTLGQSGRTQQEAGSVCRQSR
jgi:hypothetical protein